LIQREDAQAESNEDFNNKYLKEREKMDQLLDENTQLKEKLRLTQEKFDTTKKNIEVQEEELKSLRETIDKK